MTTSAPTSNRAYSMATLELRTPGGTRRISFTPPARLSDLLVEAGAGVDMPCGGQGKCGKCAARVDGEAKLICQTTLTEDAIVSIEDKHEMHILSEGVLPKHVHAPWATGRGIAIDVGTTTIAAYGYDLGTGARLFARGLPNPQAAYGADVITRVGRAMAGDGAALADAVRGCLHALCEGIAFDAATVVGNTAMLTLLSGRDPSFLAAAPFALREPFGEFVGNCYLGRCASAFIGADVVAAMLAAGFDEPNGGAPRLLADVGTNGEIALTAGGRLLCCSTAAGPALEGAGISQGMTAQAGAIDAVIGGACRVIGGGEARGICGSGLLDAIAHMLDVGALDETGLILSKDRRYRLPGTEVFITQTDVRAVQLAKSAIRAGIETLLAEAGLAPEDVPELLLAGGFGSRLNPESAERIGLLPPGFAKKTRAMGNAAGMGASLLLLSRPCLEACEAIAARAETLELSASAAFMARYVEHMGFDNADDL